MKQKIHPKYGPATIKCACGNEIKTMSTQEKMEVELCSMCHPFYTGKQKLVDSGGRVERFRKRLAKKGKIQAKKKVTKKGKKSRAAGSSADGVRKTDRHAGKSS